MIHSHRPLFFYYQIFALFFQFLCSNFIYLFILVELYLFIHLLGWLQIEKSYNDFMAMDSLPTIRAHEVLDLLNFCDPLIPYLLVLRTYFLSSLEKFYLPHLAYMLWLRNVIWTFKNGIFYRHHIKLMVKNP